MKRLSVSDVEAMASAQGFKMTPQRRAITGFLEKAKTHPSADDVYFAVNKKFPMTSRATVYNTLNWLKSVGMLQVRFDGDKVLYDPNIERHHHFVCRTCGKVEDIGYEAIKDIGEIDLPGGNVAESHEITVRGTCAGCTG